MGYAGCCGRVGVACVAEKEDGEDEDAARWVWCEGECERATPGFVLFVADGEEVECLAAESSVSCDVSELLSCGVEPVELGRIFVAFVGLAIGRRSGVAGVIRRVLVQSALPSSSLPALTLLPHGSVRARSRGLGHVMGTRHPSKSRAGTRSGRWAAGG